MPVNEKKTTQISTAPETKSSTRSRVLEILRNERKAVSGETMAVTLGLSRVAVWKAVQALNGTGYRISSGADGYCLDYDSPDSIQSWEFGKNEPWVRHYDEIGSTMDKARDEALAGCDEGLVVLAERQSAGRGTGEKKWESPAGGLFFTLVTRPRLGPAWSHRLVLRAQLAMIDAINTVSGLDAFPGWPNDILLPEGKAGGILAETLSSGNLTTFIDLGIGINTGTVPAPGGVSVPAGRKELLDAFLAAFRAVEAGFEPFAGDDSLVSAWNARCPVTGKMVGFHTGVNGNKQTCPEGNLKRGLFMGVDSSGWARIEQNGEIIHCPPGSISILNKGTLS